MVYQHRPVLGAETWEFVRGGTGNHSQEEANRELCEETGLVVEDNKLRRLGVIRPDTGLLDTQVGVWVATAPVEQLPRTRGHIEHESGAQVRWMQIDQVTGMIMRKELVCGMSLAAYAMGHASVSFAQGQECQTENARWRAPGADAPLAFRTCRHIHNCPPPSSTSIRVPSDLSTPSPCC